MFKKIIVISVSVIAFLFGLFLLSHLINFKNTSMIYGVSFDGGYARQLGLDPRMVYNTILDEWKFRNVRISAHWDVVEPEEGKFDLSELDWQMDRAAEAGAKVVLALGQKTPRWPECHTPTWTIKFSDEEYRTAFKKYFELVVNRYKNHVALETWQVENEPFLAFGICTRPYTVEMLNEEIGLVRNLDGSHSILVADSGEMSSWRKTALAGDLFGTTMYRVVWNRYFGYFNYDWLPPLYYRAKLWFNGRSISKAYVAELQAEPWDPDNNLVSSTIKEQSKSLDLARLQKNMRYAESTGFVRSYFWGAEWWYWLKTKGENEIPDFVAGMNK